MAEPVRERILVVVDDAAGRSVLARLLRQADYDVIEAASGYQALARCAEGPDLVVLDVKLPDLDGFEACRRIKADAVTRAILVLHVSDALVEDEAKVRALDSGADGYLAQPVDPHLFLAHCRALLRIRRAERALAEQEGRFRQILENLDAVFYLVSADGSQVFYVNAAFETVWQRSRESLYANGRTWLAGIHPEDQPRVLASVQRRWAGASESWEDNFRVLRPDGSVRWVWGRTFLVHDADGAADRFAGFAQDMTRQRSTEEALHRREEQIRTLVAHLQAAREDERRHVAREIHDELGQSLTGLKLELAWVARKLARGRPALARRIGEMSALTDATIQAVQRISTNLRPRILDDLGLVAALEWLARDLSARTGMACRFETGLERLDLPPAVASHVFRLFQEAFTNAVRHSGGSKVVASLARDDGRLVAEVQDDGGGFPEAVLRDPHSTGLAGMRERARSLGGEIAFLAAPGGGTLVRLSCPIPGGPEASVA